MFFRPKGPVEGDLPARKLPPLRRARGGGGPFLPTFAPEDTFPDGWPTDVSAMPRYARPRDLDFGNTGHGAEVVTPTYQSDTRPETGLERTFFSKNRRYVYATRVRYWNSGALSQTLSRRRYAIPACWTDGHIHDEPASWNANVTDVFGDTFGTAQLGDGILHVEEDDHTEALLFPLGWDGRWGLARLNLTASSVTLASSWSAAPGTILEGTPVWTLHVPKNGGLAVEQSRNAWSIGLTHSRDFIFAVIGNSDTDGGVATWERSGGGGYGFLGVIPMPKLEIDSTNPDLPSSLRARGAVVHERGRTLLWVSVKHDLPVGSGPQPSAFAFDVSQPSDVGDKVPSGDGVDLLAAVVARPFSSTEGSFTDFEGIDVGVVPGGNGQIMLAVSSRAGLEVYDVTEVSSSAATAVPLDGSSVPALRADTSIFVIPVGEADLFGTHALSADPCLNAISCGPPGARWAVSLDYDNLSAKQVQQGGVLVAGHYILWGWRGYESTQGGAATLLALGPSERTRRPGPPEPGFTQLRRIGLLQQALGAGFQQETLWPMRYDASSNRVFLAARSQYGMLSWELPPQANSTLLARGSRTLRSYPPADPNCASCGPDIALTASYLPQEPQTVSYLQPPGSTSGQLPANLAADHTEQAFPNPPASWDLAGFGYGGEWESGTVLAPGPYVPQEVLIFADRGNNAVWVHEADPMDARFLDAMQIRDGGDPVIGIRDVGALVHNGAAIVAAISSSDQHLFYLRWDGVNEQLSWLGGGGTTSLNLSVDVSWVPPPPGGVPQNDPTGLEGIFRVTELDLTFVNETPRFACALRWRQGDTDYPAIWKNGWDLALAPENPAELGTEGVLFWRIPRTGEGIDRALLNQLIPKTTHDAGRELPLGSALQPRDVVQFGSHLYVLALAVAHAADEAAVADQPQFWLLTFAMVEPGQPAPVVPPQVAARTDVVPAPLGPGSGANVGDVQQFVGAPGAPPVDLFLIQALPLHSPGSAPAEERHRLRISPDGRWLTVATGSTGAGFFLVDVGDPDSPDPVVVAGMRPRDLGGGLWDGWNFALYSLAPTLPTLAAAEADVRVGVYPVWPLDSAPTALVTPVFQAVPFVETPDGDLFMVIDGSPTTVWKIDPSMRADLTSYGAALAPGSVGDWLTLNPLQYVGGLCGWYQERKRVALSGSQALFLMGDMGVVALPNTLAVTSTDCCVIEPPTLLRLVSPRPRGGR